MEPFIITMSRELDSTGAVLNTPYGLLYETYGPSWVNPNVDPVDFVYYNGDPTGNRCAQLCADTPGCAAFTFNIITDWALQAQRDSMPGGVLSLQFPDPASRPADLLCTITTSPERPPFRRRRRRRHHHHLPEPPPSPPPPSPPPPSPPPCTNNGVLTYDTFAAPSRCGRRSRITSSARDQLSIPESTLATF